MSSLASQLANISAGTNAQVLDKKKKKKIHSVSLIYEPKEAAGQDYETIFYESLDALHELQVLDPQFRAFENSLFAETSINVDRLVQTQEQNELLDKAVENFLSLVAPRISLEPALRALEWLIRRFQIHVHNTEQFILTALPYYSSPVFVRLLDIVPTPLPQAFGFLEPTKKSAQNPSRNLMIRALTNDTQLFELISGHVARCVEAQREYHGMLAFWSSLAIWSMVSMKEARVADEEIVDRYLPAISALFPYKKRPDAQIAAYMVMVVLSSQFRLNLDIKKAAIKSILQNWTKESMQSGLSCITQLVKGDDDSAEFVDLIRKVASQVDNIDEEIIQLASKHDIQRFITVWILSYFEKDSDLSSVQNVLDKIKLSDYEISVVLRHAVKFATSGSASIKQKTVLVELIDTQAEKNSDVFENVLTSTRVNLEKLELALQSSLKHSAKHAPVAAEDVEMAEADVEIQSTTESPEYDNLPKGTVDSYLDIDLDVSHYVNLMTKAIENKETFDVTKLKLKEGSEASFLARVWIGAYPVLVRAMALNAFIDLIKDNTSTDYQALFPCLFYGLHDDSERVRRLCGSAVAVLAKQYPMKKAKTWAVDSVYGKNDSENVMFITADHAKTLLADVVLPKVKECAMDGSYIVPIIHEGFTKDKKFGESLWQYMYSHALGCNIPQLKTLLLKLSSRAGKNDVKTFTPLLDAWIQDRSMWKQRCSKERASFGALEEQVVAIVTNGDRASLKFLEQCLRADIELANTAGEQIVQNWHRMRGDSQLSIFKFLIDLTMDESTEFDPMTVLNNIKISCTQFVSILSECQLDGISKKTDSPGVAKRRRRSSAASKQLMPGGELANVAERHLRKVTVALELLERNQPDPNVDLLTQLFTILRDLLSIGSETKLAVDYVQQVLGNSMVMVVRGLHAKSKGTEQYDSNAIRIDIVVDCIRSSTSPQVQNRFLILVAELASLDREIVLHGVMPIFTFMGANTVRKDDEYSAHIIQHTVEKVIPALFGDDNDRQDDVDYILNSFATALTHIPRHRRVKMFSKLIDTIGVDLALHRFLILMAVKYYELESTHHNKEAVTVAQFGEALIRTFGVGEQLRAIKKYLQVVEIVPLEEAEEDSEFAKSNFFKNALLYNTNSMKHLKEDLFRYAGELVGVNSLETSIAAVPDAEKSVLSEECSEIISQLLSAQSVLGSYYKISGAVLTALDRILSVLPIEDFVRVVEQILSNEEGDAQVKTHALALLRSKFENEHVEDTTAQQACERAVAFCRTHIDSASAAEDAAGMQLVGSCLDGLDVMVARFGSSLPAEQLTGILDTVTGGCLTCEDDTIYINSVALANSLCVVMGARIIGHFPKIVPVVIGRMEKSIDAVDEDDEEDESVQLASLALFAGMVKRIPVFMSSSLAKIIELTLRSTVDKGSRERIFETIIESVEFKQSIDSLAATWKYAVEQGPEAVSLHLGALDVVTDACRKKEFAPFASTLVNMLLEAFSLRTENKKYEAHEVNRIESMVNASGLKIVLKLNDKTFRPLFIRMVRWATEGSNYQKLIPFFKFLVKVLTTLKRLITDYYGYLVDPVCELLEKLNSEPSEPLRRYILQSLVASFQNDRDEFWQSQARFEKICAALVSQIAVVESNLGPILVKAITSFAETCSSHDNNKVINEGVCKHIKEDCSVHQKIWGIRTIKGLYSRLGDEWVNMLPQLVPLIAELLEDDEEIVENETRRELVPVVEGVLGEPLSKYLS